MEFTPIGSPVSIPERPKNPSPINLEERIISLECQIEQMKHRLTQVINSIGASDEDEPLSKQENSTMEARISNVETELEKLRERFRSLLWAMEYI